MRHASYCTSCIDNWEQQGFRRVEPMVFDVLTQALRASPKFLLPDGGRLIEDEQSVARMMPAMRLPFPSLALEFRGEGVIAEHEVKSSKRISLVWDGAVAVPEPLRRMLGITEPSGLYVQSINFIDQVDCWMPVAGLVWVNTSAGAESIRVQSMTPDLLGLVQHRLTSHKPSASVSSFESDVYHYRFGTLAEPTTAEIMADSADEVLAALSFAAITGCGNVHYRPVEPESNFAPLNKKRKAAGKEPFHPLRELVIGAAGYVAKQHGETPTGAGHKSPVTHLRRGHIRALDERRRVWVNAAVVNPTQAQGEAATPRYRIERERERG